MKRTTWLLAAAALLTATALPATAFAAPATNAVGNQQHTTDPVPALNRAAYPLHSTAPTGPLADLRPLGRMVGDARIVGLGEATHNSREFFTLKHRVFRALVEQKGFSAFVLEGSWSTGVALDRYVVHGVGDPRAIMDREFTGSYRFWNVDEYLELIEWMRAYNRTHARKVHFVGNDLGYVGPETIDRVLDFARKTRPALVPELTRLYAGLPATTDADQWMNAYLAKPLDRRRAIAASTQQALRAVQASLAGPKRTWAVQDARAIWQAATFFTFDLADPAAGPHAMRYRDQVMADNTAWWARTTGAKVVLSAHNGHIALAASTPESYPKVQGQFLREEFGRRYVAIGTSFDHGSFNAIDIDTHRLRTFTIGSAPAGNNEPTLDRVAHRDYFADLRRLPRSTKEWLATARPTRDIGTAYPFPDSQVSLGASYDLLIHLHEISAARLRK